MAIKAFHIFKPGAHTAMAGTEYLFTQQDLQEAAAVFSEAVRPAPLVLGHPNHDAPAMGWVKSLASSAAGLFATADFGDALMAEVKAKRYPHVSAAFLAKDDPRNPKPGRWYLRHVGFLGAIAPAVKGLEPVTFAEFSWDTPAIAPRSPLAFSIVRELDVAFAEVIDPANIDRNTERDVLHRMAQLLVHRDGVSYAAAASSADQEIRNYKARHAKDSVMDRDRVAFHEKVLDLQAAEPGLPYAAAAHRLMNSR